MDPNELKTLLSEAVATAVSPLRDKLAQLETDVTKMTQVPDNDPGRALPDSTKAVGTSPAVLRFSDPDAALKQVQLEAADGDFYAFNHQQSRAFAKMVRDPHQLGVEDQRVLTRQVFAPTHLKMLMDEGLEMRAIKDLQQVAQGQLGGYAMPPLMQERIVTALPGRTAIRGNGATVITLTGESNSYPVVLYKNNSGQYVGMLRGSFSSEAGNPAEANYQTEQADIRLETYLYKIRKTTRELAIANLQQILERDILDTMALDEDRVFLTGNGAGVPLGILPGGTNSLGWKEVNSGASGALTTAGIKKLKRGLASQYRAQGVFVANSDTYGEIELLTTSGTGSDFAFGSLSDGDVLLRRPALESGFMPDVASNAYPLLYANPAGYYIVEMPGMTVARLQDTSTSVNKVEIHVMKLVGGRPVEPWAFAVQKVASA
jgi:HK97 family phage major capsid protein